MQMARDELAKMFPKMSFQGYLMDLKGEVTVIKVKENVKY